MLTSLRKSSSVSIFFSLPQVNTVYRVSFIFRLNAFLVNFLIFCFGNFFFYPRHLPTPTTNTHTHDLRHLATLVSQMSFGGETSGSVVKCSQANADVLRGSSRVSARLPHECGGLRDEQKNVCWGGYNQKKWL